MKYLMVDNGRVNSEFPIKMRSAFVWNSCVLPILKTESRLPVCQSWLISPVLYIFLSMRYWLTASIILFLPLIPIYIVSY